MARTRKQSRSRNREHGRARPRSGSARRSRLGQEFNPDYSYVKQDLRRIGLLTAGFLSILVILSFFLR